MSGEVKLNYEFIIKSDLCNTYIITILVYSSVAVLQLN